MSAERVVPYVLLGDTRRHALLLCIRAAIERWRRAWAANPHADCTVEIHDADALGAVIWDQTECFLAGKGEGDELCIQAPVRLIASIIGARDGGAELAVPILTDSTLAGELELEVIRALARELLGVEGDRTLTFEPLPGAGVEQLRELRAQRYSVARVRFQGERAPLRIWLSAAYVGARLPVAGRAPLEPLERRMIGAAEQTVAMEHLLGHAEISVADLARLTVGDVIVLSESLSSGGDLQIFGGARVGSTILGCSGGRRAIQLRPLPVKRKSK